MKRRTRTILIFAVCITGWFLLKLYFGYRSNDAIGALTLGWINFIERAFREVTVNWIGVATVLICSAIAVAILCQLIGTRKGATVFLGFWMLFVLTMASSGFFTKLREIFFSDQPFLVRAISEGRYDLRRESLVLRIAMADTKDLASARRLVARAPDRNAEAIQIALFDLDSTQSQGRFVALMAPNNPRCLDGLGFLVTGPDFAAFYPKEFRIEVGQAFARLETNRWPGNLRDFLDRNVSNRANRQRRDAPGCEL